MRSPIAVTFAFIASSVVTDATVTTSAVAAATCSAALNGQVLTVQGRVIESWPDSDDDDQGYVILDANSGCKIEIYPIRSEDLCRVGQSVSGTVKVDGFVKPNYYVGNVRNTLKCK
jgi:hypothetical protein